MHGTTVGQWLRAALAVLFAASLGAQAACDPSVSCCAGGGMGSPCGGAGVATQGNDSGVNSGAGNPINVITGNKFQREVDMPALPGVLGLELIRYYNSADGERHLLGRGWRLSYETTLHARAGSLLIVQADGTRITFAQTVLRPDSYRARTPLQGLVRALSTPRGTEYLWRWADGRELRFSAAGKLEQIRAPSGEFLSLRYDERGWLVEVIDPAGRRLRLNLLDKAAARSGERFRGVQSIDTPVGTYRYEYGGPLPAGSTADKGAVIANLVKVSYPSPDRAASVADPPSADGASPPAHGRLYHHEDPRFPALLTGVSAIGPGTGGQPGTQRLATWAYDAQRRAVLSLKGERPSSGAGLEQVSLQWLPQENGQGKTLLTNSLGQVSVYTSATIAGEARLLQAIGPGCASCGPSNRRYGYDRLGRLTEETVLDAQGRPMRSTRTALDGYGRPVSVNAVAYEHGKARPPQWLVRYEYAAVDERDPDALPSPQPVLITTPSVISGKERIVRIAYNAAQQPVTVSEEGWSPVDEQGRLVPQGVPIRRAVGYGYATVNGRSVLASVDGPLPNGALNGPEDSDVTRYEWDARADYLKRVVRPGLRSIELQREPDSGRVVALSGPDGVHAPSPRTAPAMPPSQINEDLNSNAGLNADLRIGQDPWARPIAWRTVGSSGSEVLLSADWGPMGSAAEASVLGFATPQAQARRLLDDFGRVVALRNPGQGWQFATYDGAGRLTETIDPRGARQRAAWDLADRLIRLERFAPDASTAEQVIERRHEKDRLVEERISDRHGQRITRRAYDHRGELASETLHIEPAGALRSVLPGPIRLGLVYRRDEDGRLSRTLIDNEGRQATTVQALVAGQVSRIATEGVLPAWLGGGREIVRHIHWQDLGELRYATAITHGDGTVDRFEPVPLGSLSASGGQQETSLTAMTNGPVARTPVRRGWSSPPRLPLPPGEGHDAAGLPGRVRTSQGIQDLSWNAAAQLERTERDDGSHSEYVYDARGRRVVKLVTDANGQTHASLSLYEDSRLVAEADAQGRLTHAYVHLGYRPVAQITLQYTGVWQGFKAWLFGPEARHLHTARAGRVLSVSERGQTVWRDEEVPRPSMVSGAPIQTLPLTQTIHQPLRYVGQYRDEDSGLSYHGARFFEPIEGRFISPDPAGVADALSDVPADLLLDLYAYAGGRPDEYFDPDGAAKLTYYLIDTEPWINKASGVTARWAFWLRDMGGANALTQVLYDPRGSFLGSSANPLGASSKNYAQWTSSQPNAKDTVLAFVGHYVKDMLSPDSFTQEIDDAAALQLLEDLQDFGDVTRKYYAAVCSGGNAPGSIEYKLVLPGVKLRELTLAPGGVAGQNDEPVGQRIDQGTDSLNCQQAMTPERAFQRLKRAVEIKESGASGCALPCPARAQNPAGTPASYGSTQFVVSTFVDRMLTFSDPRKPSTNQNLVYRTLFNRQANLSEEEKKALGFIDAQGQDTGLRQRLDQALSHAVYVMGGTYKGQRIVGWRTRLTANTAIDPADDGQVQQFAKETGFSHTPGSTDSEAYGMYVRMVKWARLRDLMESYRDNGRGNPDSAYALLHQKAQSQQKEGINPTVEQQFDSLLTDLGMTRIGFRVYLRVPANWNEGWQGFASAAVFTDKTLKSVLVDGPTALFKSKQKFDLISDREIRWKYAQYRTKFPDETEEEIVARIGYFHNAGFDAQTLTVARSFEYAKGLVSIWKNTAKMPCEVMNAPRLALDPVKTKR